MHDVLITGMGVGKDFGVCDVSNMNYVELLLNPHVLLWADKICLPSNDYFRNEIIDKECKMVFEILEHNKLIKRYNAMDFSNTVSDNVFLEQAVEELTNLEKANPHDIKSGDREKVPFETFIDDFHYCAPKVASLNAARYLASEINAYCLYGKDDEYYLRKRLASIQKSYLNQNVIQLNNIYKDLFSIKLPNDSILHEYGMHKGCVVCEKAHQCSDKYLIDVEKNLISYLTIRNHDEMKQLRIVIDTIINDSKSLTISDKEKNEFILRKIDNKQLSVRNNIYNLFPKAQRFANFVTSVSIPFTIYNVAANNNNAAIAGSVLAGISIISENAMKSYSSKNNWVSFIDRNNINC